MATTLIMEKDLKEAIRAKARETGVPLHVIVGLGLGLEDIPGEDPGGNDVFMNLAMPPKLMDTIRERIAHRERSAFYRRVLSAWVRGDLEPRLCCNS